MEAFNCKVNVALTLGVDHYKSFVCRKSRICVLIRHMGFKGFYCVLTFLKDLGRILPRFLVFIVYYVSSFRGIYLGSLIFYIPLVEEWNYVLSFIYFP